MAKPKTPDVLTISQAAKAAELPAHQIRAAIKSKGPNQLRSSMKEGVYQIRLVDLRAWKASKPQPAFVDPEEVIRKAVESRQLAESVFPPGTTATEAEAMSRGTASLYTQEQLDEAVSKALADHIPDISEDTLRACAERLGFKLVHQSASVMEAGYSAGITPGPLSYELDQEDGPRKPFARDAEELERLMRLA